MSALQSTTGSADLRVQMNLDHWVQFEGTAAQLIAEGLIPEGFKWPKAAAEVHWEANGFDYWLRRTRPDGHKGPMSSWLTLDNWFVRVEVTGRDYIWRTRRVLGRKAEALLIEFYEQTPAGQRERNANFDRYWSARQDPAFHAFKMRIPGLVPPKRGRKPKAVVPATLDAHAAGGKAVQP